MVFEAPPSLVVPSYNFWGLCRLSCNSNGVEGPGEVLELVPSGNTKVASYNDNPNPRRQTTMAPTKADAAPAKKGRGRPKGAVKKPHHLSKAGKALAAAKKAEAKAE